jgi:hypothetical protein
LHLSQREANFKLRSITKVQHKEFALPNLVLREFSAQVHRMRAIDKMWICGNIPGGSIPFANMAKKEFEENTGENCEECGDAPRTAAGNDELHALNDNRNKPKDRKYDHATPNSADEQTIDIRRIHRSVNQSR